MNILRTSTPKAKNIHRCEFCGEKIKIGEVYENQVIDGSDFYVWKSHVRCSRIASKLNMYDESNEGLTGNDFCECITEQFKDIYRNSHEGECKIFPEFNNQLDIVCLYHKI